jgi:lipooligosaccharide transport system permease protein
MATPTAVRALEYWVYQYRRTWRSTIAHGFINPVVYLAAMGLGLGTLVDTGANTDSLNGVEYAVFLAPGLLAAAAMQSATVETTFPIMAAIKWVGTYKAMLATPLGVLDILVGHLSYVVFRLVVSALSFFLVMAAFGAVERPGAVLAVPAAVLTGMAFACPIAALAAHLESEWSFNYVFRFGVIPLFLFSGTFFPVSQLPDLLRPIAYATPLWHGVDLCRSLALGTGSGLRAAAHVAYLGALVVAGVAVALHTYRRRLTP